MDKNTMLLRACLDALKAPNRTVHLGAQAGLASLKLAKGPVVYLHIVQKDTSWACHQFAMAAVGTCKHFFPNSYMTSGSFHGGFDITVVLKGEPVTKAVKKPKTKLLTFKFTRARALQLGLLTCANCGYPENNHYLWGSRPCAHDDNCKGYKETRRK